MIEVLSFGFHYKSSECGLQIVLNDFFPCKKKVFKVLLKAIREETGWDEQERLWKQIKDHITRQIEDIDFLIKDIDMPPYIKARCEREKEKKSLLNRKKKYAVNLKQVEDEVKRYAIL